MIEELYHRTPDVTIQTRCQIILLSAKPMRVPQIAQVIFSSKDTVARCIHEFHQSRLESLLPNRDQRTPAQGHAGLLEAAALAHRARSQNAGPSFLELTAPLLADYVAAETGMRLDESRIRHYLHASDYELLRPVLTVASPDPEYESKKARIEDLQRQAEAGEIDLYYEDEEIDLALLPTITRCWCKRGHQRTIETPRNNQKRSGAGLIQWVSGKLYWAKGSHKENALFRAVLSQVLAPADGRGRRKISVVVDTSSRMLFAKPVLTKFSAHPEQIELVTRPSSSPQLNPARRFWKHVRRNVTHTTFFQAIDRLLDSVTGFLRDMAACPQTERTVAG